MSTSTQHRGRITLAVGLAVALALVPAALAGKGGGAGTVRSGCAVSPGQAVLDQVWTTSAWGLPTKSTVSMIIKFPDGATSTGPITVHPDGTFTTSGSSNMTAGWGFIAPEQTGTYTYQFVGKVKWPAGTYTQSYATCSVVVS